MSELATKPVKPIDGQYRTQNPEMRVVRFYRSGSTTDPESTAIVTKIDKMDRGILDLLVLSGGRSMLPIKSVRHAEDAFFEYMPDARKNGVWDYLEIDRPTKKPEPKVKPKTETKAN